MHLAWILLKICINFRGSGHPHAQRDKVHYRHFIGHLTIGLNEKRVKKKEGYNLFLVFIETLLAIFLCLLQNSSILRCSIDFDYQ